MSDGVGPLGGPFEPDSDLRTVIGAWRLLDSGQKVQILRLIHFSPIPERKMQ